MRYVSTRGGIEPIGFQDAALMGLARDGGLILPETLPNVAGRMDAWRRYSYLDLAAEIIGLFSDLSPSAVRALIQKSYAPFDCPEIVRIVSSGGIHILELFHGPTLAFKDIALQFLGNLFDLILSERNQYLNILAATSGDTGSAAIHGVKGRQRIRIFVMHPHGKISRTQELQMTTVLDPNVFNLAIDGTFDDCQRIMKAIFSDLAFKDRAFLGSVNSINWARLVPQIVYYFYAAMRVMDQTGAQRIRFAVPTGNFGDILAGYLAARMGLPISQLVLAANENDVLSRFFNSGVYRPAPVKPTISPSMDIQVASNFERYLYYRMDENPRRVVETMTTFATKSQMEVKPLADGRIDERFVAGSANTADTLATMREFHGQHGYLLDPHSAVGVFVASRHLSPSEPMICLATAHPAKFCKAIEDATGKDIAHHPALDALVDRPSRCDVLPASIDAVREYIAARVGG